MLEVDYSGMDRKLAAVVDEVDRIKGTILKETAEQAIKTIVSRTRRKGQDYNGKAFTPYSTSYAEKKRKDGASTRVNLTSTGQRAGGGRGALRGDRQGGTMMNSLTIIRVEERKSKYIIGAARRIEQIKLARHVRGDGNLPKRDPLGFTKQEETELSDRATKQFLVKIRKIGLS